MAGRSGIKGGPRPCSNQQGTRQSDFWDKRGLTLPEGEQLWYHITQSKRSRLEVARIS